MFDEPEIPAKELLKPDSISQRGRPRTFGRAVGAAVPAVGFVLWVSALLGVGPMDGHEAAGLLVTVAAFGLWRLTLGRTVKSR
ncbi:MAG: hypothetical protein WD181_02445 [Solirubrobacterales bacterium]